MTPSCETWAPRTLFFSLFWLSVWWRKWLSTWPMFLRTAEIKSRRTSLLMEVITISHLYVYQAANTKVNQRQNLEKIANAASWPVFTVDLVTYITRFQWDMAKYPIKQSLKNISEIISKVSGAHLRIKENNYIIIAFLPRVDVSLGQLFSFQQATQIDSDLKARASAYNNLKGNLQNLERKNAWVRQSFQHAGYKLLDLLRFIYFLR